MIAIDIPQYEYISQPRMKALAIEFPYGNAHRGVPFGEKNGPILAALPAISAISAGFATTGLLGGLLIAGGALGLVGAFTGNKTLMAIGSVAGLAGGFIGATGTADAGSFFNPFAEGASQSAASAGFDNVFSGIKKTLNIGDTAGAEIAKSATAGGYESADMAAKSGKLVVDGAQQIGGGGAEAVKAASNVAKGASQAQGAQGLLSTLVGSEGIMGMVSGAAEGFQNQPVIDAKVDNLETDTDATKQSIAFNEQRMANKQFQDTGNMAQANNGTNVYQNTGAAPGGRFAVVVGNEVKYVTQEEYAALRAQQTQQPTQTAGMINPAGATA